VHKDVERQVAVVGRQHQREVVGSGRDTMGPSQCEVGDTWLLGIGWLTIGPSSISYFQSFSIT
jgi:hypothetical protein